MKSKKAQVTLYIIIGIVVTSSIFLFLYIADQNKDPNKAAKRALEGPIEMLTIRDFVDSCIKMVSAEALSLLGLQNGITLGNYAQLNGYKVNYADSAGVLPIGEMEKQLSDFVAENLPDCIDNFEPFKGRDISGGAISAKAKINELDVDFTVDYKVVLTAKEKKHQLDKFIITHNVRLKKMQKITQNVVNQILGKGYIELYDYLGELDVNASIYAVDGVKYFVLEDEKSKLDNLPYKYVFATT